jgi:hypothetical protein
MGREKYARAWFGRAGFGPPPWAWRGGPFGPGRGFGPGPGWGFEGRHDYEHFHHGRRHHGGWEEHDDSPAAHERHELFGVATELGGATMQVAHSASEEQLIEAQQVLKEAKRSLYQILAREEPEDLAPPSDPPPAPEV